MTSTIHDMLNTARNNVARCDAAIAAEAGVLRNDGWVLLCQDVPLQFTIGADRSVTEPRTCHVDKATRFTYEDAVRVAAATVNGNNLHPTPVPALQAFCHARKMHQQAVDALEGALRG